MTHSPLTCCLRKGMLLLGYLLNSIRPSPTYLILLVLTSYVFFTFLAEVG